MRRQICWVERLEERAKREISVSISGKSFVEWKIIEKAPDGVKRRGQPTPADWDELERRAEAWYCRRAMSHDALEVVKKEHAKVTPRLQVISNR